jgi:hypothetical protein
MTNPAEPPQLNLFEAVAEPSRQRGGIPRHVPTPESRLLVNELKAAGKTQEAIARALGIGTSTLATHYYPSRVACPPMGRRRHAPTAETRAIVRRAIRNGMGRAAVARLIGISLPTLRLYYRVELQPAAGLCEGG